MNKLIYWYLLKNFSFKLYDDIYYKDLVLINILKFIIKINNYNVKLICKYNLIIIMCKWFIIRI